MALIITLAFIMWTAIIDSEHLKKKQYIDNHADRWFQRACFFFALGIANPAYCLGSALLFTALFDQLLNFKMKRYLFYLGTTAKWDRFFRNKTPLYIIVKISCLIIGSYLLLK